MPNWTNEQRQVIDARNCNLLVSAAAGSGKTAVLIERIIELLTDNVNPTSVDRLLIVTFTNAAAGEMRDRLYKVLIKRINDEKDEALNAVLRRQLILLPQAQISTIDGFCSYIVRNYSSETDLSSGFRVGDKGELALIQEDTMNAMLEEEYQKGDRAFLHTVDKIASGKTDKKLAEIILNIFKKSESSPNPEEWFSKTANTYAISTKEDLENSEWFKKQLEAHRLKLKDLAEKCNEYIQLCLEDGETAKSYEIFANERDKIAKAAEFTDYEDLRTKVAAIDFVRKKKITKDNIAVPGIDDKVDKLRNKVKEDVKELQKQLSVSIEDILIELKDSKETAEELIRLTKKFAVMYSTEKRKKNIADFSDIEHFALSVLKKDGKLTPASDELAEKFSYIFIDEYQDSNLLQEEILTAVSGITRGNNNVFMVGDMKQSIYGFREARPELFMEKYERYSEKNGAPERKIELHSNFRSRETVLSSVNYFFYKLMKKTVGGIEYDDKAALYPGAVYEETDCFAGGRTEIIYIDTAEDGTENEDDEDEEDNSTAKAELSFVVKKIQEYMDTEHPYYVQEKKDDKAFYRPVKYSDFAVLYRSANAYSEAAKMLASYGIPAVMESKNGYFDTFEVSLVLDYLRVIDNPVNDIPLASLMRSPVFSFTSEELALIKINGSKEKSKSGFYRTVKTFSCMKPEENENLSKLIEKTKAFLATVDSYREKSYEISLALLVREIIYENGIMTFAIALPGGDRRKANLEELIRKAENFEKTSYHGVFRFLRYVDKITKYDDIEGERNPSSDGDDAVRVMTVHRSKGLEFPIVFLLGAQKKFNLKDLNAAVLMHPDMGIAFDNINLDTRQKKGTYIKKAFSNILKTERIGEELRILYVALTRARERLFIVGASSKALKSYNDARSEKYSDVTAYTVISATSYADWFEASYEEGAPVDLIKMKVSDIISKISVHEEREISLSESKNAENFRQNAEDCYNYNYRYDDLRSKPASVSVSSLKEQMNTDITDSEPKAYTGYSKKQNAPRPLFMEKEGKRRLSGAEIGTETHNLMYRIDPEKAVAFETSDWVSAGIVTKEEEKNTELQAVREFFLSDLGKRFRASNAIGKAYREKSFIVGVPVKKLWDVSDARDKGACVMLQGIIDMYFEEDGNLILVDYKTDNVSSPEELVKRYAVQLNHYADALNQMTGLKVTEKWIYSFKLHKEILIKNDV